MSYAKWRFRAEAHSRLGKFLAGNGCLQLPAANNPAISILLVLYNQAPLTFVCLRAIAETVELPCEIIIVDNASVDDTGRLLERIQGARILRNSENRHFLNAVNQAARLARGKAVLLLNNDAVLTSGALQAAYESLFSEPEIGAVGGKLVLPGDQIQEAGSIIWNDGSCAGYARGAKPDAPECQFRREVDYCSGAFLLVRRELFEQLGSLDTAFAPAYYEETDLCMRLREAGFRVVYDPRAEVRHFEFGSSPAGAEHAFALMRKNQELFRQRHRDALRHRFSPQTPLLFARCADEKPRVLMIDDQVPLPSYGAGFPRAASLLKELHAAGWFVTQYPTVSGKHTDWAELRAAFPLEIEFMLGYGAAKFGAFLQARAGYYDLILISRPPNMARFLKEYASHPGWYRGVSIVYDAEAVFAARETARLELAGAPLPQAEAQRRLTAELELARPTDAVVAVSAREAAMFAGVGIKNIHVLGHALIAEPTEPEHGERQDFLLVGALPSDDSPNADGLLWFVREVMPVLDGLVGDGYQVRVAGDSSAPCLRHLRHPRVELLGRIDDLTREYRRARVFVAPTRFAAGLPHKLHEAAARGVPAVATALLVSQLGWQGGIDILSADTASDFAAQCARLYTDARLWRRVREAALERVVEECSPTAFTRKLDAVIQSVSGGKRTPLRTPRTVGASALTNPSRIAV